MKTDENKYTSEVVEVLPNRDLTRAEKIRLKTADTVVIGQAIDQNGGSFTIENPLYVAIVAIHNPKNKDGDTDYNSYIIVCEDGAIYSTSSESAFEGIADIMADMANEDGTPSEPYSLMFTKRQSKNNSGKFISVSLA